MVTDKTYEQQAREWLDGGRPDGLLLAGVALVALNCWLNRYRDTLPPAVCAVIEAFRRAAEARQPDGWFHTVLQQRSTCTSCGTRYRIENLSICVRCHDLYCYQCIGQCRPDGAGHRLCLCGGELVG
ncbi:MAG: hypothetical protein ACOY4U_01700 [Pseudomonadota bacterium]